jgi:hypothetical protein
MSNQGEKIKEYSRLNDYYLKISLNTKGLTLISLNTESLDNHMFIFSLSPEEIKENAKYKNMSVDQLYEKIIELIEKEKYLIKGDKNCVVLSIYEGEKFDLSQDLQFFLIKSNEEHQKLYQEAMKKILSSYKKENTNMKKEINDLKINNKALSDPLNRTAPIAEVKSEQIQLEQDDANKKSNLSVSQRSTFKKRSMFGFSINTLSNMTYNSYPSVELSDKPFNIIVGYGGNTYNGLIRKYNEDIIKIIPDYQLNKVVKKKNGEEIKPKISYFAVYDGHGGDKCCTFLSQNLHDYIFNSEFFPLYTMQAISAAYQNAEKEFFSIAVDEQNGKLLDKSGSCAITALIMDDWCFVINLGDSRALYSYDSGNKLYQVSRDHKPNDKIEFERIQKAGGSVYKDNMIKLNGKIVQVADKDLPPGVTLPYRIKPGNIAVSLNLFFN